MGNENNNALFTTLFSLLNFKNVEIHSLEWTCQSMSDWSSQF